MNDESISRLHRLSSEMLHANSDCTLERLTETREELRRLSRRALGSSGPVDIRRSLAFACASLALSSLFPGDEELRLRLSQAAAADLSSLPADAHKCLLLTYLYGATWDDRYLVEAQTLVSALPEQARTHEARQLLESLQTEVYY